MSKIKIFSTSQSLILLQDRLNNSKKVSYVRFGDNDIFQCVGKNAKGTPLSTSMGMGGNRTVHSPELKADMQASFTINDDNYLKGLSANYPVEKGMEDGVFMPFGSKHQLEEYALSLSNQKVYYSPIMWHYLFCFKPNILKEFFRAYVQPYPILFIGSVRPKEIECLTGEIHHYIQTPAKNSYATINEWWPNVEKVLANNDVKVVLPATGQATRVVCGRLWQMPYNLWTLDIGSLWDCLEGNMTRTWIRKTYEQVIKYYK